VRIGKGILGGNASTELNMDLIEWERCRKIQVIETRKIC